MWYNLRHSGRVTVPLIQVKVKESRNRPGVAQRVPGGLGSQTSWHSAHEGGEFVSHTHRPTLPPGMFLVLIFTRDWVGPRVMVRSEGETSLKNPTTPPGIDPGTVRLVAQRLNHYAAPGPLLYRYKVKNVIRMLTMDPKQLIPSRMYVVGQWIIIS